MMAQMGGGAGGMPQLPGNVGIALDEYGRPFLVMRDQVIFRYRYSAKNLSLKLLLRAHKID